MRLKEYEEGGIDPNYYTRLSEIESNNNSQARSKTSSASGKFQFITSTWQGMVKKYGLPYSLEDRFDPDKSRKVAELYTQENANYLKSKLGTNPTNTDLYAAHFMGVGGAAKLLSTLKQNPNASAHDVASPAQIAANKPIFLRKDGTIKTAQEVYNTLNYKVTKIKSNSPDSNFKAQGYDQQEGPQGGTDAVHQFSTMYGDDFYNTDRSQNVSSLDRSQEIANLAQEKQDRAAEIKARLDQKAAEKTFMAEMIQKSQVAYVNPADFQAQSAPRALQEEQFQKGGQIPISSQGMYQFPNQTVLVPTSGSITMKDIPHDILGISQETGQQILMRPEQEYFFPDTKTVLETPQSKNKNRFSK